MISEQSVTKKLDQYMPDKLGFHRISDQGRLGFIPLQTAHPDLSHLHCISKMYEIPIYLFLYISIITVLYIRYNESIVS